MFSIIIPSYNNIEYLKCCIESIRNNSSYNHEIIVHVSVGEDGTCKFLDEININYTFTKYNAGICEGVNKAVKIAKKPYILYSHDDFYFCPEWDKHIANDLINYNNNLFYISGTMMNRGQIEFNCGNNLNDFDENNLLSNYHKINHYDYQGSTWAPHLIHIELWKKVGGFSESFFPGYGSDPDFNMKLWNAGVRIFKGLGSARVYHFGSVVGRKKNDLRIPKKIGSRGSKQFLIKWGISIKFFKKYYLRSGTTYNGPLDEPKKNFNYYVDLFKCKLNLIYLRLFFKT